MAHITREFRKEAANSHIMYDNGNLGDAVIIFHCTAKKKRKKRDITYTFCP